MKTLDIAQCSAGSGRVGSERPGVYVDVVVERHSVVVIGPDKLLLCDLLRDPKGDWMLSVLDGE